MHDHFYKKIVKNAQIGVIGPHHVARFPEAAPLKAGLPLLKIKMATQAARQPHSPGADGASSVTHLLREALLGNAQAINWCESDYAVSPFVAEWWNTISNFAFLVALPPCPLLVCAQAVVDMVFAASSFSS